ncbi:major facilitator superfamily domain-containing protein [Xylariales sp. PMI_506]|nr:major facilitator superfamily domain-containing protein [Xylariales sp. PMI_506]
MASEITEARPEVLEEQAQHDVEKNELGKELTRVETQQGDEAQVSYYSKTSVYLMMLFSGLALGSDGYNASVVGNLSLLMDVIYPNSLTDSMYTRLSNAFLIGMIIGMLFFGVLADQIGRKAGAVATTGILILGIVLSTAASGTSQTGMLWMLIVARGITGVGAGGEYPVSGAGALEASDEDQTYRKSRGFMFAMVSDLSASLGYCFGALVPLLLLLCVDQRVEKYELVWRVSFALGAIAPLSIIWFRLRMAVSTAYRRSALKKQKVPYLLIGKRYWRRLIGGGVSWFLYNWISIPFGIFSSTIVSRVNPSSSMIATLGWGVLINAFYIPGPFIGGFLSDRIGRRRTMALGFLLQAILGFILGGANQQIQTIFPLFIVLYGIFLTLGEIGPGSTVAVVATEPFPTSIRGQTMGLISAFAKAGAAIGTEVFTAILNAYTDEATGNQVAFLIGAGFAILGALNAYFVVEDVDKNLNEEDHLWKEYLVSQGWEASWGDDSKDPIAVQMQMVSKGS